MIWETCTSRNSRPHSTRSAWNQDSELNNHQRTRGSIHQSLAQHSEEKPLKIAWPPHSKAHMALTCKRAMSRLKQDALKCFATSRRLQAPLIQAWLTCPEINLCALDSSSRTEMLDVGRRGSLPNRLSKHGHSTPRNTNHPVDGARYLQETKKLECLIHRLNTGHLRHDREDLNSM